jgi:hypothetical protein
MPHKIGYVDNSNGQLAHYNMLALLRHFCGGFGDVGAITQSGTGNGTLSGVEASPTSITESWTLTCTAAATNGGTFSVTGSVSGAKPAATVGVAYDNGLIKFTLNDGTTDFAVGKQFQVPVTRGAASVANASWQVLRYDTSGANRELIMKGLGLSREEEIFVGFRTYQDASADYYNLLAANFTGYVPGNTFDTQPGAVLCGIPAHNQRIDYWLTLNGQRIVVAMKVGTPVFESGYVGKFLPYARPSQYPYPLVCGGMLTGAAPTRFSDTTHSCWVKGGYGRAVAPTTTWGNMRMRFNDGTWKTPEAFPWNNSFLCGGTYSARDTGNSYPLSPVVLNDATSGIFGELDGIYHVSGFNNAVENTLVIGGNTYVVFQDVWRTGFSDYYAVRMDT